MLNRLAFLLLDIAAYIDRPVWYIQPMPKGQDGLVEIEWFLRVSVMLITHDGWLRARYI